LAGTALCNRSGPDAGVPAICVSPSTIVRTAPYPSVTIHTNLPYSKEAAGLVSVAVNGKPLPVASTFSDTSGDLVAKVQFGEVLDALGDATSATFTLTCGGWSASDTARVMN